MQEEVKDKESSLEQHYHELLDETKRKLQAHEVTIQRLTSTLADKDQQLQVKPLKAHISVSALFCFIGNELLHSCVLFPFRST